MFAFRKLRDKLLGNEFADTAKLYTMQPKDKDPDEVKAYSTIKERKEKVDLAQAVLNKGFIPTKHK